MMSYKKIVLSLFLALLLLPSLQAAQTCTTSQIAAVDFDGISGNSDNNVVAAGENGEVYIFDGTSWTVNPVIIPGNPGEDLEDVSVINDKSSVVVGKNGTVLLQDNDTWSTLPPPNGEDLKAVWAYSTTDFYVFGKKGTVYHYNGAWSDLSGAAGTGNNDDFEDAWGNGTFLYGLTKAGELFQLTLGGNWTTINTCATAANQELKSLWGDAAGNLYLAGKGGDVFYYELSSGNCTQLSTSASEDLEGIYGSAATGEIYAVGKNGTVFYGTATGTTTTLTETTVGNEDLKAVWLSSAGNAFYAAKNGFTSTCTYTATPPAAACSTTTIASNEDLNGVSGSSDSNVVAAGDAGEVYIYDGTNWSTNPITIPNNPNEDLEDVSVINDTSSVVVGKNGTVLLQDSGTWSTLTTPNGEDLKAVWAYSTTDFYVFGKKGTVYHYNGAWSDLSGAAGTGNNDDFEDAWGNGTFLYGLTKAGELFQLTLGGNWTTINTCATAANQELKSLWGDAAGNLYLAGKGGDVFYYELSSGNCTQLSTSASEDLEGIYGSAATGEIYAVGKNGTVFYGTATGTTTTLTETTVGTEDFKAVWVSTAGVPYYAGKGGTLTICSPPTTLHHIEFIHDTSALTCNPEQVTVKACANADCSTLSTSATTVGLLPTGWVGGDSKTFTGSSNYNLQHTIAETVTLSVGSISPTASNTLVCKQSDGTVIDPCTMTFNDSGFIFDVTTQTSCVTSSNITISAVRKNPTTEQCIPFFNGKTAALKLWTAYSNPNTGTKQAILNYSGTDYPLNTAAPGTDISMNFDANGQATFTLNYPDAGELDLNATYAGSVATSDAGLSMSGNKKYVTKPAKLYVYSDDTNAACASNDGTCTAFKPAGNQASSQFNLKIRAACANNSVTPNFALDNIIITHTNTSPAVAQGNIAVTSFNMAAADNGEHTITTQSVSEVGAFTFSATSPSYLSVTGPVGTSTYIGRFYPHHFDTTVAQSCGTFSYSGQNLSVTATAQNNWLATPTATQNYTGSFAFNTTLSNAGDTSNFTQNIIPAADFNNGTANKADVIYTFPTKETVPLTITLRANDADTGTSIGVTEGSTQIRSGRTRVENSYGSELVDMAVTAQVEFYNTNGFEINTADTCSSVDVILTDIGTDPITLGTGAGQTCLWDDAGDSVGGTDFTCTAVAGKPQFSEPASNGNFNINLKAPGADITGDIDVTLTSPSWLKYDWDGDGTDDNDPTGTASFGLYRGDDRVIYWREVF